MATRTRRARAQRWIGLMAAVLLVAAPTVVSLGVSATPALAWDTEDCTSGVDCPGDPGGGSLGSDNGDCVFDSCGDGAAAGDPDPSDTCTDTSCQDGQNPPEQQCEIIIKPDGTLVCIDNQPGPSDPPPADCLSDGSCPDPITEDPIDPSTCAPQQDGNSLSFNQDNFVADTLTTDPFPSLDPVYNDACPPPAPPPPAATQFGATVVAVGDSFMSGEGQPPFGSNIPSGNPDCDLSPFAWSNIVFGTGNKSNSGTKVGPILVPGGTTKPFENWACSGATSSQVSGQIQAALNNGQKDSNATGQQFAGIGTSTRRVLISAGGNDLGFGPDLRCAIFAGGKLSDSQHATHVVNGQTQDCIPSPATLATMMQNMNLSSTLVSLYKSVDAPFTAAGTAGPPVDAVDYPMFFPAGFIPACGIAQTKITRADQVWINLDVLELDDLIRKAAAQAGVNWVDFSTALQGPSVPGGNAAGGATICDSPAGVNTLGAALALGDPKGPFHPNGIGYQRMAAAYTRENFFPQAGASAAFPADGTLVADRGGDAVYVAAGGALFPFANQPDLAGSSYSNSNITMEPSLQVAAQLQAKPANGTLLKDAATGTVFSVDTANPEGTALMPLQPSQVTGTPVTVPDASLAGWPIADGSFVVVPGDSNGYEIIGGAPVVVTNASHVGSPPPGLTISQAQFGNLPQYPADGTFARSEVKTFQGGTITTTWQFIGGAPTPVTNWSNVGGQPSYTLPLVDQGAIDGAGTGGAFNHLRAYPADGTLVTTASGTDYVFAGGAPVVISNWDDIGGQPDGKLPEIDQAALDNAGTGGDVNEFNHVRQKPADGTYITGMNNNGTPVASYVMAGGAPIAISDWTHLGGPDPATPPAGASVTNVDETAIDNAGTGGAYNHLAFTPADGTFVTGGSTTVTYEIIGGAPVVVTNWNNVGGKPSTPIPVIDQAAIDNAGTGGAYNHLRQYPADGTFVTSGSTTATYEIIGGAPVVVINWANVGGKPSTPIPVIDQAAIDNAGTGGFYNHLRQYPADSTYVTTASGTPYVFAGGAPLVITNWASVGGQPSGKLPEIDQAAIDNAGTGGFYNHVRQYPADNTLLALTTGNTTNLTYYVVAGGAPVFVDNPEDIGGARGSVTVDPNAITNAGGTGPYSHLRLHPADGTIVESFGTGKIYQIESGTPILSCTAAPTFLYIAQDALNHAGSGAPYNNLNPPVGICPTSGFDDTPANLKFFFDSASGTGNATAASVSTPAADGSALDLSYGSGNPAYTTALAYTGFGSDDSATTYQAHFDFLMPATTPVQALTFTMSNFVQNKRYQWALQWQNLGGGQQWKLWTGTAWQAASASSSFSPNVWYSVTIDGTITNGKAQYQDLIIDGTTYALTNFSYPPTSETGDGLVAGVALTGDSGADPYHVYIDDAHLTWK